ncbi:hypothetical protein [Actinomadura sp. 9N215]|uniref:hypothetical protein n=1 Tax=Actinomadura sp. 9N215 TaxID=3375150 RepID=UPI0037BF953F
MRSGTITIGLVLAANILSSTWSDLATSGFRTGMGDRAAALGHVSRASGPAV